MLISQIYLTYLHLFYLFLVLKTKSSQNFARQGNFISATGMFIAMITATLISNGNIDLKLILVGMAIGSIIGLIFAVKVEMTQMPQMVAIFNGFGGGASALVAAAEFLKGSEMGIFTLSTINISVFYWYTNPYW